MQYLPIIIKKKKTISHDKQNDTNIYIVHNKCRFDPKSLQKMCKYQFSGVWSLALTLLCFWERDSVWVWQGF